MGKRCFSDGEMRSLLGAVRRKAAKGMTRDRADRALVVFAYATGCRASEIASVGLGPGVANRLDLDAGTVVILDAKWETTGAVPLDPASLRVLRRYVREVRPRLRGADASDRLFLTRLGTAYSANAMSKKLSSLLRRHGFGQTAHAFRHYFCTDLLRTSSLHVVKGLMRHRDTRSTMMYAHPSESDLRGAVNRRAGRNGTL